MICLSLAGDLVVPKEEVPPPDLRGVLGRARCLALDQRGPQASWVEVAVLKNGRGFLDITGLGVSVSLSRQTDSEGHLR